MNHQPFETWMFEMDQLEPTQAAALNAHLAECPECRRLMESWQAVEYQLKTARPISPAPGFTAHWQANLPIRQQREQLQQARQWLWGLGSASLVMAFALVVYLLTTQSPVTMFVNLSSGHCSTHVNDPDWLQYAPDQPFSSFTERRYPSAALFHTSSVFAVLPPHVEW